MFPLQLPSEMVQALITTVVLICMDTILGWVVAIKKGEWDWRKVGRFVETAVLPYIGGLLALAVLAVVKPDTAPVFYASVAAADAKMVADIISKIGTLGVPVQKPELTDPGDDKHV